MTQKTDVLPPSSPSEPPPIIPSPTPQTQPTSIPSTSSPLHPSTPAPLAHGTLLARLNADASLTAAQILGPRPARSSYYPATSLSGFLLPHGSLTGAWSAPEDPSSDAGGAGGADSDSSGDESSKPKPSGSPHEAATEGNEEDGSSARVFWNTLGAAERVAGREGLRWGPEGDSVVGRFNGPGGVFEAEMEVLPTVVLVGENGKGPDSATLSLRITIKASKGGSVRQVAAQLSDIPQGLVARPPEGRAHLTAKAPKNPPPSAAAPEEPGGISASGWQEEVETESVCYGEKMGVGAATDFCFTITRLDPSAPWPSLLPPDASLTLTVRAFRGGHWGRVYAQYQVPLLWVMPLKRPKPPMKGFRIDKNNFDRVSRLAPSPSSPRGLPPGWALCPLPPLLHRTFPLLHPSWSYALVISAIDPHPLPPSAALEASAAKSDKRTRPTEAEEAELSVDIPPKLPVSAPIQAAGGEPACFGGTGGSASAAASGPKAEAIEERGMGEEAQPVHPQAEGAEAEALPVYDADQDREGDSDSEAEAEPDSGAEDHSQAAMDALGEPVLIDIIEGVRRAAEEDKVSDMAGGPGTTGKTAAGGVSGSEKNEEGAGGARAVREGEAGHGPPSESSGGEGKGENDGKGGAVGESGVRRRSIKVHEYLNIGTYNVRTAGDTARAGAITDVVFLNFDGLNEVHGELDVLCVQELKNAEGKGAFLRMMEERGYDHVHHGELAILWRRAALDRVCAAESDTESDTATPASAPSPSSFSEPDFVWTMESGLSTVWGEHPQLYAEYGRVLEELKNAKEAKTFFRYPPITVFLRRRAGAKRVYCVTTVHTPGSGDTYTKGQLKREVTWLMHPSRYGAVINALADGQAKGAGRSTGLRARPQLRALRDAVGPKGGGRLFSSLAGRPDLVHLVLGDFNTQNYDASLKAGLAEGGPATRSRTAAAAAASAAAAGTPLPSSCLKEWHGLVGRAENFDMASTASRYPDAAYFYRKSMEACKIMAHFRVMALAREGRNYATSDHKPLFISISEPEAIKEVVPHDRSNPESRRFLEVLSDTYRQAATAKSLKEAMMTLALTYEATLREILREREGREQEAADRAGLGEGDLDRL